MDRRNPSPPLTSGSILVDLTCTDSSEDEEKKESPLIPAIDLTSSMLDDKNSDVDGMDVSKEENGKIQRKCNGSFHNDSSSGGNDVRQQQQKMANSTATTLPAQITDISTVDITADTSSTTRSPATTNTTIDPDKIKNSMGTQSQLCDQPPAVSIPIAPYPFALPVYYTQQHYQPTASYNQPINNWNQSFHLLQPNPSFCCDTYRDWKGISTNSTGGRPPHAKDCPVALERKMKNRK